MGKLQKLSPLKGFGRGEMFTADGESLRPTIISLVKVSEAAKCSLTMTEVAVWLVLKRRKVH
jgi:hypothetical protein